MINQNPEQIARDNIDKQLTACGWIVQSKKKINLGEALGVAVLEYQTDVGPAESVTTFIVNVLAGLIAYSFREKKPSLNIEIKEIILLPV